MLNNYWQVFKTGGIFALLAIIFKYGMAISNKSALHSALSKKSITHVTRVKQRKKLQDSDFVNRLFDFSYVGDVALLPLTLKQYNPELVILSNLGSNSPVSVSINLKAIKLADIQDVIYSQTAGRVRLIYDFTENSIRLAYTTYVDVADDAVKESLRWQHGMAPKPVLKRDGLVLFPYGEYQPTITCQPLNLCDIELQGGEEVQGVVIGDSLRWNEGDQNIPIVYSGNADALTPHLVLKPSQSGLETSLMITTSKRTYMLKIKSANDAYVARVGFYYPREMVQGLIAKRESLVENIQASTGHENNNRLFININKLNYQYLIDGDDYIWKPSQVFDDGISVYIRMPEAVTARNLPSLCVLDEVNDVNKCEMVNFRYNDHFYVVDKLFDKAKLINGFDNKAQIITIKHVTKQKGFFTQMFN